MEKISTEQATSPDGEEVEQSSFNSVYIYADSGARGSPAQIGRKISVLRYLSLMSRTLKNTIIYTGSDVPELSTIEMCLCKKLLQHF